MKLIYSRSIGGRIKFGYIFIIAMLVAVISAAFMVSIDFNKKHNEVLQTIVKANKIQDWMGKYTLSLINQISLAERRKELYNNGRKVREEAYENVRYLDRAITKDTGAESRIKLEAIKAKLDTYYNALKEISDGSEALSMTEVTTKYQQVRNYNDFINNGVKDLVSSQLTFSEKNGL